MIAEGDTEVGFGINADEYTAKAKAHQRLPFNLQHSPPLSSVNTISGILETQDGAAIDVRLAISVTPLSVNVLSFAISGRDASSLTEAQLESANATVSVQWSTGSRLVAATGIVLPTDNDIGQLFIFEVRSNMLSHSGPRNFDWGGSVRVSVGDEVIMRASAPRVSPRPITQ